jgi:hypothetical protein
MKTLIPLFPLGSQRLLLLTGGLVAVLLTGCSSEKRDRLWQTIDPAGYKHAHSESFNGARALRSPESSSPSKSDDMALELN